ncbi:MAG: aminotransferase class I/II-fold pyridoxal phosphate-dependent enzyme, partial [Ktedonobacterales bacterium]
MSDSPPFTRLISSLPATVPFVAPEAIERMTGRPIALRLGANESTFGPSPKAIDAMCAAAARVSFYGDPESYELRQTLARHLGVGMEHLVIGCGIDDLLGLIVRVFLEPGETAVTSLGAYPTFNYHVAGYGGRIERVPYRDDRNNLDALAVAAARTGARLVFLANPDNPTGSWYSGDEVITFAETLQPDCLLLLDEAYCDFAPATAISPIDTDNPRVIRLRTFSKAHGMA